MLCVYMHIYAVLSQVYNDQSGFGPQKTLADAKYIDKSVKQSDVKQWVEIMSIATPSTEITRCLPTVLTIYMYILIRSEENDTSRTNRKQRYGNGWF